MSQYFSLKIVTYTVRSLLHRSTSLTIPWTMLDTCMQCFLVGYCGICHTSLKIFWRCVPLELSQKGQVIFIFLMMNYTFHLQFSWSGLILSILKDHIQLLVHGDCKKLVHSLICILTENMAHFFPSQAKLFFQYPIYSRQVMFEGKTAFNIKYSGP